MEIYNVYELKDSYLINNVTLSKRHSVYTTILSKIDVSRNRVYNTLLNEADLNKTKNGDLFVLGMDKGKVILNKLGDDVLVFVSSHADTDGENRYPKNLLLHDYIFSLDYKSYNGCRSHIKYIIEDVCNHYLNETNKDFSSYIKETGKRKFPNIEDIKSFIDVVDDIPIRMSIYTKLIYDNTSYIVEGVLGAVISFLSYEKYPLAFIKKYIPKLWERVRYVNNIRRSMLNKNSIKGSDRKGIERRQGDKEELNELIKNINEANLSKPVLYITSYSTVFKRVSDFITLRYIPDLDLYQKENSNDIYTVNLKDKSLNFTYPINDIVYTLSSFEYNILRNFEKTRNKHGAGLE